MTEAIGRGIVAGIELTKPELLEVLVSFGITTEEALKQIGGTTEEALKQLEKMLLDGRLLVHVGSENFGVVGNSLISGSGVLTCGLSGIGFATTNSPAAKGFYALSFGFSGTAATTGGMAALARKCEISEVAFLSETFGAAFLVLGKKAHAAALRIEGKPVPARFRRAAPSFGLHNPRNNAAFIMPFRSSRVIEVIPFEQIGKTVGFSISIYCYGRIIITAYRYGQQLIGKYKKKKLVRKKLLKISKLLLCSIYTNTNKAVWKRKKLYYFAIS